MSHVGDPSHTPNVLARHGVINNHGRFTNVVAIALGEAYRFGGSPRIRVLIDTDTSVSHNSSRSGELDTQLFLGKFVFSGIILLQN